MCGENVIIQASFFLFPGSPPRVRGKPSQIYLLLLYHGITPACAGKTKCFIPQAKRLEDHPRVCGENKMELLLAELGEGSPPRVRGKPISIASKYAEIRITPACAGKTIQ